MTCYLIDTNVFLRAILDDHNTQSTKPRKLIYLTKTSTSWTQKEWSRNKEES